nr:hypothetical protein [uncultured Acetatifactor sp.]
MDLSETKGEVLNRHPWELSRTQCVLKSFSKYIDRLGKQSVYINAGAGDLYFDKALLERHGGNQVHAVDLAYESLDSEDDRIYKYHYLEDIDEKAVDYAVMMDSLEYMQDDVAYMKEMCERIRGGGFFFFTLPAFPCLFSDYDVNIKNLRRYSRKSFDEVLSKVPELEKLEEHNFYTSLFVIRFLQKAFRLPIDPDHKFTAGWKYEEDSLITRFLTACLNLDYECNRLLGKIGLRLPGLSMLVICRKKL